MAPLISIRTALCLNKVDTDALVQGNMIVALARTFVQGNQQFALCSIENLETESDALIQAWATVEFCHILTTAEDAKNLSRLTIWSQSFLQSRLKAKNKLFLVCLRVYDLPDQAKLTLSKISPEKVGGFAKLPNWLSVTEDNPILGNDFFEWQRQQLEQLKPHQYVENQKDFLTDDDFDFRHQILAFLKLQDNQRSQLCPENQNFISNIVALGEPSKGLDLGKSNHQVGTDFENVVRQSLEFLGFTVDEQHKGGAGGLDLFCSKPYALAIECKAGKRIPDGTVEQIDRIAKRHLKEQYLLASRLIIGPGTPTQQLQESALYSSVSIMSPKALQRLVEIQAKYPNSINLIELREYLKPGSIDQNINEYIEEKVLSKLKLRLQLLKVVSECLKEKESTEVEGQYILDACRNSDAFQNLDDKEVYYLLIELSSPFAGYLGRIKTSEFYWNDRFYFLRDLVVEENL